MKTAHGIVGSQSKRAPRSKRDKFLPPHTLASVQDSRTKPTKKKTTPNTKPRRNVTEYDNTSSSSDMEEDNSVSSDSTSNARNLTIPTSTSTNDSLQATNFNNNFQLPLPPSLFYNPTSLSQYYQF
jgi:hypothetical protein